MYRFNIHKHTDKYLHILCFNLFETIQNLLQNPVGIVPYYLIYGRNLCMLAKIFVLNVFFLEILIFYSFG